METQDIYKKMDQLVDAIVSLSSSIKNNEVKELKFFLNEIARCVPQNVEDGLTNEKFIAKKQSLLQVTASLDEAKVYLSMLESFGYGSTSEIKNKVDEFNELLTRSI